MDLARRNLEASVRLLQALMAAGLELVVVCPGSRSGPLAVAAGLLEGQRLRLRTALDERSAAFFALGHGRASGHAAAVITTSGTAVANLLPACVEADLGAIPLLLISADRPQRLKGCGANQAVNQEQFLLASVRLLLQGHAEGLAAMAAAELEQLAAQALAATTVCPGRPPGPVHLNLPIEEPLHGDGPALESTRALATRLEAAQRARDTGAGPEPGSAGAGNQTWTRPLGVPAIGSGGLDPDQPGLVVAGPWRGLPQHGPAYREAVAAWQRRSGWPVLADGLSGLRGWPGLELVTVADLLPDPVPAALLAPQVLRLGPLPASRRLQQLLRCCGGRQLLITEGEPRHLDPLGTASGQWPAGLAAWIAQLPPEACCGAPGSASLALARRWHVLERQLQAGLDTALAAPAWGEPALARQLSLLLPPSLPLVIANSSPVRDWDSFAAAAAPFREVYAFRGASGIDGTLSLACGVAEAVGAAVLLCGDLALLHDSNGWLWRRQLGGRLTVVLIDNGGGGIFEQLAIRPQQPAPLDFERLFAMPQAVDPLALAAAHGVPGREVAAAAELPLALSWALEQPLALLRLCSDRRRDAAARQALRRMASVPAPPP